MSSKIPTPPSAGPRNIDALSPKPEPKDGRAASLTSPEPKLSKLASNAEGKPFSDIVNEKEAKISAADRDVMNESRLDDDEAKRLAVHGKVISEPKLSASIGKGNFSSSSSSSSSEDRNSIPTPASERELSREKDTPLKSGRSHESLNAIERRKDYTHRRSVHQRLGASRSASRSRDDVRPSRHRLESPENSRLRKTRRSTAYYRGRSRSRSRDGSWARSRERDRSGSRSRRRTRSPSSSYERRRYRRRRSRSSSRSRDYSGHSRTPRRRDRSRSWERRRTPSSSRSRSPLRGYYRSPSRSPRSRRYSSRSHRDYGYRRSYRSSHRNWSPRKDHRTGYNSSPRLVEPRWRRQERDDSPGYTRNIHDKKRRRISDDAELDEGRDLRTIFVWRLVQQVKEEDVFSFFSRAGKVRDVRLIMDRRSSRHKGAGYVEFFSQDSVKRAVALAGGPICGFPVAIKPSAGERATAVDIGGGLTNVNAKQASKRDISVPNAPSPALYSSGNTAGGSIPGTAVGWSARQPVRQVHSSSIGSSTGGPVGTATLSAPTELVSISELKAMLNPNNLPILPVAMSASLPISPSKNLLGSSSVLEQVPLPTLSANGIAKAGTSGYTRLYVGSVPFQLTESHLHAIFAPFGVITSLQLQRDASTGRSRGYGFVEFAEHSSAKKAMASNGIDVLGRPLKVALASQDGRGVAARGNSMSAGMISGFETREVTGELDEGRDGGVSMNASQKALLRERLSRGESMVSGAVSAAGVPWSKALETTQFPSKSLLLSNMFDPSSEPAGFEQELAEDVRDECASKYGSVTHLFVDKLSRGQVYIRFASIEIAQKAMISLNGRWFGGQRVSAAYVLDDVYRKRFSDVPA